MLHVAELLQQSVACQVRVTTHGQTPLVVVPRTEIDTLVPQQRSKAVGGSKDQAKPHWTVLLVAQVMVGARVSTTVTVWLHVAELLQQSVASQVLVSTHGQ